MPIVYKLLIGVQAQQDLEEVWASDPSAAGVLEALLERLKTDQQLLV